MTALAPPPADATAEEWGAFAAAIPGWNEPRRMPWMPYLMSPSATHHVPDPDHWAWEGWMLRLIGARPTPGEAVHWQEGEDKRLGRACIRVAAALGRWPGGGE